MATYPDELTNVWDAPEYRQARAGLVREPARQQEAVGDSPHPEQASA